MPVAIERRQHVPDILDCLAQLSNDEVPTPPKLARAMLDLLPKEVWSNPDYKWLDPCCKSGAILRETAARLLVGLEKWQPDFGKRREHIFRNMLYGTSVTELTGQVVRRSVYCSHDASGDHSVVRFEQGDGNIPFVPAKHNFGPRNRESKCEVCGAPKDLERGRKRENYAYAFIHGAYPTQEMSKMKFDVIVGNPPYQVGTDGFGATASTIYHEFVMRAIELKPKYALMVTPSRWFSGGKGLDEYRARMIADRHLRALVDNPKVFDCFPGVKIEGGVSYFLWDRDYNGDCSFSTRVDGIIQSTEQRDLRDGSGVLVRDNRAMDIIRKAAKVRARVEDRCTMTKPFGLTMRSNYPGSVPRPFKGAIPLIYGTKIGYSRPDQIQRNHQWINRWKVLVPMAFGDGQATAGFTVLGEPIALAPGSACTQTYFVAGMFDTREETENYAHYLASKFVRFLVLQRKTTQHLTPDRFRFVPMLDMKRRWTDEKLYKKFGLTAEERDYIERSIKPRSVELSLDSPIPASHLPGGNRYRPGAVEEEE
jgi:site-specific DNA-methyltransferase (adenine-specific)